MSNPIRVAVTGAAGQLAYSLVYRIASGEMFGKDQPVVLNLVEIPPAMKALEGVAMELDDCAFSALAGLNLMDNPEEGFAGISWGLLVGSRPRGPGMERGDLLAANGKIFVQQGKALQKADANLQVLVVGNPANTNCLIALKNAGSVPAERFHAMTRLDHNRACAQLAKKAGASAAKVRQVTIWGNHSATQFPDFLNATINGKPATEVISDRAWLEGEFIETVQKRGAAIIAARGLSSAASAANAVVDHVQSMRHGVQGEDWISSGVLSDGSYGAPQGIITSYPIRPDGKGGWSIVQNLPISDFAKQKISASWAELEEERDLVKGML